MLTGRRLIPAPSRCWVWLVEGGEDEEDGGDLGGEKDEEGLPPSELFLLWIKDLRPPGLLLFCSNCCRVSEKLKEDL